MFYIIIIIIIIIYIILILYLFFIIIIKNRKYLTKCTEEYISFFFCKNFTNVEISGNFA